MVTFLAIVAQSPFLFSGKPDELLFIPLALFFGLGTSFLLGKGKDNVEAEFEVSIFFIAFSLRLMLGVIIYGWDLSAIFGDEDSSGYMYGWTVALSWYKDGFDGFLYEIYRVVILEQNVGQSVIWGAFMFIAGAPSRMIVSVINSFVGSVLVIIVYRLAKKLFDFQTAKVAAILVTFWLSIVILSSGTSKEMMVICAEWSILYLALRNSRGLTQKDIILAAPIMLTLYTLRFYAFYMCAIALFFRAILTSKKNFARNSILGIMLVISLLGFLSASGAVNKDFERFDRQSEGMNAWRTNVAGSTGSGTDVYSEYKNNTIAGVPLATTYFFFAPFPWELFSGSLRASFAAAENIIIIFLFAIGFTSIKTLFKERFFQLLPIIVFCVLYAGMQIWGFSNVGLAWRHRQTIMPLFFLLAALSLTKNFRKRLFPVI